MKIVPIILSLVFVAMAAVPLEERFAAWAVKNGKKYSSESESVKRMLIFAKNEQEVEKLNAQGGSAWFAVNKFSDMTESEFRSQFLQNRPSVTSEQLRAFGPARNIIRSNSPLPVAFDWREHGAVGPVKDQGGCGSCWAFGTVANLEAQWAIHKKQLLSLSEQQLVDCDHLCMQWKGEKLCDAGCNGGFEPNAISSVAQMGGIMSEADYPYHGREKTCTFDKTRAVAHFSNFTLVNGDEEALREFIHQNGPVSVELAATGWSSYSGGVFDQPCGTGLEHSVVIVGWGTEGKIPFWWIKNSWGSWWGLDGYIKVIRGKNKCNLLQMVTIAVV